MSTIARLSLVVLATMFGGFANAQDWRKESITSVGVEFDAPSRLERLPMQLGEEGIYHRARLRPKDDADYVRAQYTWYCDVYEFSSKKPTEGDDGLPDGIPEELKEKFKQMLSMAKPKTKFKEWLDDKDQKEMEIVVGGKPKKGRGKNLDYVHWVWLERNGYGPAKITYCEAAVYSFPEREVALVIEMPLESDKPPVPKAKWKGLIDRIVTSGAPAAVDASADDLDKKRDQYADTPEKKEALATAKKNIADLKGWDYFTQPNYIVLYSWDFEKPDERAKARKEATYYATRLEKMRELYLKHYPLDATGTRAVFPDPKSIPEVKGPTTGSKSEEEGKAEEAVEEHREAKKDELGKLRYSVFRLCAKYEQFMQYGQSPPGVVGWFSPASKELVVFLGGDVMMGKGATETVTYHEGWHQYADFYFDHPQTASRGTLHRWFDEGHGDFFGGFRYGVSGWKYIGSDMRHQDVKEMVRKGDYVPFRDIVHWDMRRFYGARAPYYYAQAFSMIDFLRRGPEKDKNFDPRWADALDMYRKVMLVHGKSKLASDTSFRGFSDDDWKKLEEAWKAWVNGPHWLNGK
ncbi:MAG: hypothetical protein JNK15_21550 [Planctomycetes bacterium]|nr:hypothetical protein [Planctomycetota bacterium]